MGVVFAAVLVGMLVWLKLTAIPPVQPATATNQVLCQSLGNPAVHYHSHLDIFDKGQKETLPAGIGLTATCDYWLHTHDTTGVIHIEAPASQAHTKFTLADFFSLWGQPLGPQQVAQYKVGSGQSLIAFVNGKRYSGDPGSIVLKAHEDIALEIVPPLQTPPRFQWPAGL
ncbi:MAG: hypothetical protein ACREPI_07685 [Candidatus Dormibacterales bacterium]